MGAKYFGAAVRRLEDPRFLRGEGRFVDDVTLPGVLHAAFLRSPHAHATLVNIRTDAAKKKPGVVAVFTHADLARWMKPLPLFGTAPPGLAAAVKFEVRQAAQYPLAKERVRYVGEIVAMVVADDRGRAEDAVEAIAVEYAPHPAAVDMLTAGEPGAPLVHPEWGTNVAVAFRHGIGDADRALAGADVVLEETFRIQRYVGMPLEGRGVVAAWDRRDGTLTTWNSTQVSHFVQQGLVTTLELPPNRIRVIAPDLGGGFGTKASGYAEDALVPIAARALGRPVKWIEDRREHMMSAAHARHQTHTIRLGARRDGTIVGLADRIWLDLGAYNVWGIVLPYNTVAHLIGPYRIRDMKVDVQAVVTNKTPNAPYRGAGRPETVFAMDRAVDCLARRLRLDPADVRRKNYIRPEELPFDLGMPYRDGNPLVYDSGDFPAALESALIAAEYDRVRKEQTALRARGLWRGVGISGYVEGTAIGPFEGARVTLDAAGRVQVATGAVCSGQGHETSFAQVAADALGVPLDWVTVTGGDTAAVKLVRYVVAHDCGRVINPIIVDGQVHGGVAQGVGGALFEDMAYDADGQLLAGSLMDYAVPVAGDLPLIETVHLEFPSPRNPLGMKGLGEGGAISPPAAIANAIDDALAPLGVRLTETPALPWRVRALIAAATAPAPAGPRTGA